MLLHLQHPEIAGRSCEDCQKYIYDPETGIKRLHAETGKGVPRIEGTALPCHRGGKGCPMGSPENRKELSDKNWLAWQHYLECRAVGVFPSDPIVRRNASLIMQAEQIASRVRQWQQLQATQQNSKLLMSFLKVHGS